MKTPSTHKEITADPRVHSVERYMDRSDYSVMIYLNDGYRAKDGTSTLYGRTAREAAKGLKFVTVGEPD